MSEFQYWKIAPDTAAAELIKKQWFAFSIGQKKGARLAGTYGRPGARSSVRNLSDCRVRNVTAISPGIWRTELNFVRAFAPRTAVVRTDATRQNIALTNSRLHIHPNTHTLTATARLQYFYTQYSTHTRATETLSIPDNAEIFYYKNFHIYKHHVRNKFNKIKNLIVTNPPLR